MRVHFFRPFTCCKNSCTLSPINSLFSSARELYATIPAQGMYSSCSLFFTPSIIAATSPGSRKSALLRTTKIGRARSKFNCFKKATSDSGNVPFSTLTTQIKCSTPARCCRALFSSVLSPRIKASGAVAASTVPMATPETTPKAPSLNPPRSLLGLKRGSS